MKSCKDSSLILTQFKFSYFLLSQLHWLPVVKWIKFKIATLVYQSVAFGQPSYLFFGINTSSALEVPLLSLPEFVIYATLQPQF